jgi:excisionase family DNA binding protein
MDNKSETIHWLTTKEAASYLHVHPLTLRRWASEGRLPAHRLSGVLKPTYRWRTEDLDRMLVTQ